MAVDRGAAVSAATRIKAGLMSRDSTTYLMSDLQRDAWQVAEYLTDAPAPPPAADREPDNPVSPEFLTMVGFSDPTTQGNVFTVQDVDGRELKYLLVGQNGEPECHLLDDEGEGCRLPAPETEGDLIQLCRLLKFPVELPV